jgi:hypothetical protein
VIMTGKTAMPKLVLHPRAAPGDRLRVWVGAFGVTDAPALTWRLDGAPATPAALKPLQSARPPEMVDVATKRAFTGVYEFRDGIHPGRTYRVASTAPGADAALEVRALPAAVPEGLDDSFNVLVASCFYHFESRGTLATIVAGLPQSLRPHLSVLMGDQVYLDLPSLRTFGRGVAWQVGKHDLAATFERDYLTNWSGDGGLANLMNAAPAVFLPDDHEYWNNYPHPAVQVPPTLTQTGRAAWTDAARALYDAFQTPFPEGLKQAVVLDIDPLSIFLLDTRTFRAEDRSASVLPEVFDQFRRWCRDVARDSRFGVVVTAQPLTQEPTSLLTGKLIDRTLPDYGDFGPVVQELGRLAEAGRPVLLVTGDVHWGRVTEVRDQRTGGLGFIEVVSSPTSLVTTIVVDAVRQTLADLRERLRGQPTPWPRHSEPPPPTPYFAKPQLGRRWPAYKLADKKGDHLSILSFRQTGFGLGLKITYLSIPSDGRAVAPLELEEMKLRAAG